MTLENEYLFGYATSMEERISILDISIENYSLENLKRWRRRKSLLSETDFGNMLKFRNFSEVEYDLAVSTLDEDKLKKLYNFVKYQDWFKLHKKIFSVQRIYEPQSLEDALYFHVLFYMDFVSNLLPKYSSLYLSSACLHTMKNDITHQLMSLAQKTLVWDIRSKLQNVPQNDLNETEAFNYYLTHRFGNNSTEYFFLEYPTLTRLLSERLKYVMDNLQAILNSIENSEKKISAIWGIEPPFCISKLQTQKGDSHNRGQSTTMLEINQVPMVYKFRDNNILKNYNLLLDFIQNKNPNFYLYKSKCIIGKDYCIEEFINNETCLNEKEIIEYYQNYGCLVALTYWLGSTDLHKDNLIAKGKYPILIDVETLFRAEENRTYSKDFTKIKYFEANSVISTGLLPMDKYWKKQIDYSALNGIKQKLPFKVRRLFNENNSKIAFELCEAYTNISNNVPKLNGKPISYKNYSNYIMKSFEDMILWLSQNGELILDWIYEYFYTTPTRVILRDTQDYYNFLDFSTHPSCMVDYIEREKIFENLWNNSFITPKIVMHEISALCRHDIPYFYTIPCSNTIYSLDGKLDNYFCKDMLTVLKKHCNSIDQYTIEYSSLLLGESLDSLNFNCKAIQLTSSTLGNDIFENKAIKIADLILENVIIDNKNKAVLWPEPTKRNSVLSIDYPDFNLYNGTSGLLIFFYLINALQPNLKYKNILQILEYEVFNPKEPSNYESAFHGTGARIAVSFVIYYFNKEKKYHHLLIKSLVNLYKIASTINSWDWIRGKGGLLALLTTIYEELQLPIVKKILEILVLGIDNISMSEIGFAHGYCGILYALLRANTILQHKHVEYKILDIYQTILNYLQDHREFSPAWCNGTFGINKALFEFSKQHPEYEIHLIKPQKNYVQDTSCLCHGSFAEISDYNGLHKGSVESVDAKENREIFSKKEIFIYKYKRFLPLGFFTGLTGIGYQLLRCKEPEKYIDLLFFEIISCI